MEQLFKEIKVSYHTSGKIEGLCSIDTSSLRNPFCEKMSKTAGTVCQKCYAIRAEKYRTNLTECYNNNNELLSSLIINYDELPRINALYCRFNAFGELINETHFINLLRICKVNQRVSFSLWTKNKKVVDYVFNELHYKKPKNLKIILSSIFINLQQAAENEIKTSKYYDKLFTVYSKDYINNYGITINCGATKCKNCMKCYNDDNTVIINEKIK